MDQKEKKTYTKPKLRIIELAAEEVLGTGCKVNTTFHFGALGCNVTGNPTNCPAGALGS